MAPHCCSIAPPYLLKVLASSDDQSVSESATVTLAHCEAFHQVRQGLAVASSTSSSNTHQSTIGAQGIVPGYVHEQILDAEGVDDETKQSAQKTLAFSKKLHAERLAAVATAPQPASGFFRPVYDMKNFPLNPNTGAGLPGTLVRDEGQPPLADKAVNEAYDNAGKVLGFYRTFFNRQSIDGHNFPIVSSVHYSKNFANAAWIGELRQMIYGDGNRYLSNFTGCIDVIGHEITVSMHYL
jgi:Zn-dependent metalloprotease